MVWKTGGGKLSPEGAAACQLLSRHGEALSWKNSDFLNAASPNLQMLAINSTTKSCLLASEWEARLVSARGHRGTRTCRRVSVVGVSHHPDGQILGLLWKWT